MISEIGTIVSSISLLLQLIDSFQERKIKNIDEYKSHLKSLVSTLHFSKSIHHFSHTIIDLNYIDLFNRDISTIGLNDFQKLFNNSFGNLLQTQMELEINPNLCHYKSQILNEPQKYKIKGFSNSFITSVNSLNQCYPKMIANYEELNKEIIFMNSELTSVQYEKDFELKIFVNYENNKKKWKYFVEQKAKDILTYADHTILNGITILDTLFMV